MARFIIQNKVYETDKMEHLGRVQKWYEFEDYVDKLLYGKGYGRVMDCELYRSKKGNYLLVRENDYGRLVGEAIGEAEAKRLLMNHQYEKYVELFGALEEA